MNNLGKYADICSFSDQESRLIVDTRLAFNAEFQKCTTSEQRSALWYQVCDRMSEKDSNMRKHNMRVVRWKFVHLMTLYKEFKKSHTCEKYELNSKLYDELFEKIEKSFDVGVPLAKRKLDQTEKAVFQQEKTDAKRRKEDSVAETTVITIESDSDDDDDANNILIQATKAACTQNDLTLPAFITTENKAVKEANDKKNESNGTNQTNQNLVNSNEVDIDDNCITIHIEYENDDDEKNNKTENKKETRKSYSLVMPAFKATNNAANKNVTTQMKQKETNHTANQKEAFSLNSKQFETIEIKDANDAAEPIVIQIEYENTETDTKAETANTTTNTLTLPFIRTEKDPIEIPQMLKEHNEISKNGKGNRSRDVIKQTANFDVIEIDDDSVTMEGKNDGKSNIETYTNKTLSTHNPLPERTNEETQAVMNYIGLWTDRGKAARNSYEEIINKEKEKINSQKQQINKLKKLRTLYERAK